MLYNIQNNQGALYHLYDLSQGSFKSFFSSPTVVKTKEFVVDLFQKIADLFQKIRSRMTNVDDQSSELNLKPIAMVGVIVIIGIYVLSMVRDEKSRLIPPPTPKVKHKELETDLGVDLDLDEPEIDLKAKK